MGASCALFDLEDLLNLSMAEWTKQRASLAEFACSSTMPIATSLR